MIEKNVQPTEDDVGFWRFPMAGHLTTRRNESCILEFGCRQSLICAMLAAACLSKERGEEQSDADYQMAVGSV